MYCLTQMPACYEPAFLFYRLFNLLVQRILVDYGRKIPSKHLVYPVGRVKNRLHKRAFECLMLFLFF